MIPRGLLGPDFFRPSVYMKQIVYFMQLNWTDWESSQSYVDEIKHPIKTALSCAVRRKNCKVSSQSTQLSGLTWNCGFCAWINLMNFQTASCKQDIDKECDTFQILILHTSCKQSIIYKFDLCFNLQMSMKEHRKRVLPSGSMPDLRGLVWSRSNRIS